MNLEESFTKERKSRGGSLRPPVNGRVWKPAPQSKSPSSDGLYFLGVVVNADPYGFCMVIVGGLAPADF